ncbi:MAG: threonylcarbamoyl-AMP synthase [Tindallia sp. MSAO_Bac2]|nr:MAG: threonylcarbamoyl-AMP synthase [Tindallia sp. MSAO_Bac2]
MKNTLISTIDADNFSDEELEPFAEMLKSGKTVAFPTETVYGLGANALDSKAVRAIFQAKGRPSDNPLIVHVASRKDVESLVEEMTPLAQKLADTFWPGPLTIIQKKKSDVPETVTAGLDTVAVRMPSHPVALRLIALAGVPVAAPSANLSGKPSPTRGSHVIKDLNGRVDGIIDGGMAMVGLESTVVDATGEDPVILRPGGITREQIMAATELPEKRRPVEGQSRRALRDEKAPRSPGMKYTHYAPDAPVLVIRASRQENMVDAIKNQARHYCSEKDRVGILCTEETLKKGWPLLWKDGNPRLERITSEGWRLILTGSLEKPETIANRLFDALRSFDDTDVTVILAEAIPEDALGQAIMNRLLKASKGEMAGIETDKNLSGRS